MTLTLALAATLGSLILQDPVPSPSPPSPLRIGGEIKEPKKLRSDAPHYPDDAVRAGLRGLVVLECVIDTKGAVSGARVLTGVPPLSDAAIKAVKKWRYTPTLFNGVPVPVIVTITVNFKRDLTFRLEDLLESLRHRNEFIRESAALWLGTARHGPMLEPSDIRRIAEGLRRLAEHDESERVRGAAARALAEFEAK